MWVVFGLLLATSSAWTKQGTSGDSPASKEDIQKLFVALHVRERLQLIMDNSRKQAKAVATDILKKELPEASKEELTQMQGMINEMVDDIDRDYPMDAILNEMIPIYQRHLTKSDADELIASIPRQWARRYFGNCLPLHRRPCRCRRRILSRGWRLPSAS